ncbi:putative NADP-dependent mannitol dehydrogenase [Lachnellula hyalina]|uniref:Putative NADP-dependent mannitol dehydrogenase n=1 Tax=Lachnellula hyalina TaxID=1316788 RepID=A0A8H8U0K7_9HELO|nr:putative NADP-dependent mannitol dehydrogenase [Lachnellula hyalina]TVY27007.1 putative NADP-dependent mannitol dehydrogenase [Lachnellula hyalina]
MAPSVAQELAEATSNGSSANGVVVKPQLTLTGKVIAADYVQQVTGGNRGIGLGVAECCLINDAAKVYSIDLAEPGDEFAAILKKFPGRIVAIQANVTDEDSIAAAVDKIVEESGAIHGIVVNAGWTNHKAALDFTKKEIEDLFNVNSVSKWGWPRADNGKLFGSFYTARVAAKAFIKLGIKGSVVFTASMASYRPNKIVPSTPYGASKAGVRNMTHTLAMEWAKYGIRVNSVSPGLVRTAMTYWVDQQPDWEQQLKYYGGIPRLAEVQELGGAYVYLLSDAASYTTSIDIPVNGVIGNQIEKDRMNLPQFLISRDTVVA